jgi:hypothetical protein
MDFRSGPDNTQKISSAGDKQGSLAGNKSIGVNPSQHSLNILKKQQLL